MPPSAPTSAPPAPLLRFPGFDGLRAIAALSVLMTHVADSGGANAPHLLGVFFARLDGGVAIFFVVSGLLLARPFIRANLVTGVNPVAVGPYLVRRALRIYPAYWLALTVIVFVFGNTEFPSLRNAVLDYTLLHIYSPHQPDVFAPLVQSWTLATEVAFYLFLPVYARVIFRRSGPRRVQLRRQLVGVAGLVVISTAWKVFVLTAGFGDARIGQLKMWLPWWLDLFAVGMVFALGSVALEIGQWRPPAWLVGRFGPMLCWTGALGTFWWVAAGAGLPHTTGTIDRHLLWGQHYLYGATAALLVLPLVFGPQDRAASRIHAFVQSRVMVLLGTVSYGIYLWHEGWIERYLDWTGTAYRGVYFSDIPFAWHTNSWFSVPWLTFTAAILVLTVATATISWYGFERPVMRLAPRTPRGSAPTGVEPARPPAR